jgi:hypothetical protein
MVNRSSLPSANDKKKQVDSRRRARNESLNTRLMCYVVQERGECSTRARNTDRGVATTVTVETVPPVTVCPLMQPCISSSSTARVTVWCVWCLAAVRHRGVTCLYYGRKRRQHPARALEVWARLEGAQKAQVPSCARYAGTMLGS